MTPQRMAEFELMTVNDRRAKLEKTGKSFVHFVSARSIS